MGEKCSRSSVLQRLCDCLANLLNLRFAHHARKWQRETAASQIFGDGKIAGLITKFFNHIGLQMDGRKLGAHGDAARDQFLGEGVAVNGGIKADDVDEP